MPKPVLRASMAAFGLFGVAAGAAAQATAAGSLTALQIRHLSGFASIALEESAARQAPAAAAASINVLGLSPPSDPAAANHYPGLNGKCGAGFGSNTKINQNCLNLADSNLQGRSQAQNETAIAQDPNAPRHLVASFNDYRRGDGTCGAAWSVDGGDTWHDSTVPNGFVRGAPYGADREYFQAGGDTAVAWDTKGNAYLQCQMFMRGPGTTNNPDLSSGVYLFRSTGNAGASWNFPGRPVVEDNDFTGSTLEDKPYMTVDNRIGSPYQDRVYVTWTEFAADGTGYIWEAHSNDYGEHFSPRVLVSGNSALCTNTYGLATPQGNCNENQYSQPFTGPDGALYVVYANFNNTPATATDNRNQMLLVKSVNGGATFSAPVKVGDYYDLPDCASYQGGQDAGRACVPEKGASMKSVFRAANYPAGAVDPSHSNRVVVSFGSYIGPHSNEGNGCTPAGFSPFGTNAYSGVKTQGACKNDILISVSTDGGASFTGTATDPRNLTTAAPRPAQATADQWFQWLAFSQSGKLAISYYDRAYGTDEITGYSDVSIAGSNDLAHFAVQRVTSSSMPPPTQFPDGLGNSTFWGDYAGLAALDRAHPSWSDTRAPDLFLCPGTGAPNVPPAVCTASVPSGLTANDQEIYTDSTAIPTP